MTFGESLAEAVGKRGRLCVGIDPHGPGEALRAAGAHPIRALSELPALFRAAMRAAA